MMAPKTEKALALSALETLAVLAGRKTQFRAVVTPQPTTNGHEWYWNEISAQNKVGALGIFSNLNEFLIALQKFCPYGKPGDTLWLREKWFPMRYDYKELTTLAPILFADGFISNREYWGEDYQGTTPPMGHSWKPSSNMPHWASRILLEIVSVRVERLQDISLPDVRAEGCEVREFSLLFSDASERQETGAMVYRSRWESINGTESWQANPWVWVVEFKRVLSMSQALWDAGFRANPNQGEPPHQIVLDERHTMLATVNEEQRIELTIVRDKGLPGDTAVAIAITHKSGLINMVESYRKELVLVNKRLKREKK